MQIDIAVGSSIAEKDYVGRWDIAAAAAASPHVFGPAPQTSKPLSRTLVYNFPRGVRTCRIVWLRFSLRSDTSANPFAAQPSAAGLFDLLSLDPTPPPAGSAAPRAPACVHASRILVLGESLSLLNTKLGVLLQRAFCWKRWHRRRGSKGRMTSDE